MFPVLIAAGTDPHTGEIADDTRAEAIQTFANLEAILAAAGARLTDVIRVGTFMKQLQRDRPAFNQVWAERFGDHRPVAPCRPKSSAGHERPCARPKLRAPSASGGGCPAIMT